MIPLSKIPHRVAVPALIGLFLVCGFVSLSLDSATFDETAHIGAGVSYLETGDFRLNPEHPPLVKLIAAAPLALLDRGGGDYATPLWQGIPVSETDARRSHAYEWRFGFGLLNGPPEAAVRRDPAARLVPARCTILLLGALLLLVVYAWARALFGAPAGLLALALAVTCPTLLAHARLVTTDLPAAVGFTGTSWLLWRWLSAPSWRRAALTGAALGAALLLKFSCALLVPLIVLITAVGVATKRIDVKRATTGLVLVAAIAYLALWAGYGFRFAASRDPGYVLEWKDLYSDVPPSAAVVFAHDHRLVPEAYLYGFAFAKSWSKGRIVYLDGVQSIAGWYRYFPEAFFFKTPLAFMALALWVLAAGLVRTLGRSFDGWCLGLPPLVFAALAIESRFNIGHRHVVPVYPFLCVAIAPAATWLEAHGPKAAAAVILTASCLVSFGLATPRYLSYFNLAAGGPRSASKHFVDSNLDWGQDLRRLKGWMDSHGVRDVDLAYFGTADPRAYGINYRKVALFIDFYPDTPVVRPERGRYLAASVTLMTGLYLDADRAFSEEAVRRGFVDRAKIEEYLVDSGRRAEQGLALIHTADWMQARGFITAEKRREAEDAIPATWLKRLHDTAVPIGWAGDSIAIYHVE